MLIFSFIYKSFLSFTDLSFPPTANRHLYPLFPHRSLEDAREEAHGLQVSLEMEKSAHNEARRELGATKADLRAADAKLQEKVRWFIFHARSSSKKYGKDM